MYKKTILFLAVGIISAIFWFWAKPWIENPLRLSGSYGIWIKPLVALIFMVSFEGLAILLVKESWARTVVISLVGIFYLVVFYAGWYSLLAVATMALLQWNAGADIQSESKERTKINIKQILHKGVPSIVTSILILVSFAYFFNPATQAAAKSEKLPVGISQIIEKVVPIVAGDQVGSLTPIERRNLFNQITNQVTGQISSFLKPYFKYLPPILAFGLFIILQGFSFIFVWLAILVSVLIFGVLKKTGMVKLKIIQKESEELEF